MSRPGMVVGQKGVKYGLQLRSDRQPPATKQPAAAARGLAAFGVDSDSDEDVGAQVARQAARKVADSKVGQSCAPAVTVSKPERRRGGRLGASGMGCSRLRATASIAA